MKKFRYKKMLLFMAVILLAFAKLPLKARAVSGTKVKKAYAKFLKGGEQKYKYFSVVNAGKKKEPILMVTDDLIHCDGKISSEGINAKLYYYSGGSVKAVKGGEISSDGTARPLAYRANHISIMRRRSGTVFQVSKGHMVGKTCILVYVSNGTREKYYMYSFKDGKLFRKRAISRQEYKKFDKKWSSSTPVTFHRNHAKNRKKYLKGN